MNNSLKQLEERISSWPDIAVHSHRFMGREFRFGRAEVGHVHVGGVLDIPFTRSFRNELLSQGLAEEHHWVPDSGWITFHIRKESDIDHALWLMRLSYLRYALKAAPDPIALFEQVCEQLHLSPNLKALLEDFVPQSHSAAK